MFGVYLNKLGFTDVPGHIKFMGDTGVPLGDQVTKLVNDTVIGKRHPLRSDETIIEGGCCTSYSEVSLTRINQIRMDRDLTPAEVYAVLELFFVHGCYDHRSGKYTKGTFGDDPPGHDDHGFLPDVDFDVANDKQIREKEVHDSLEKFLLKVIAFSTACNEFPSKLRSRL